VRHEQREAVARCPSCAGFFCRECILEHEGRVLCSDCLAREIARGEKPVSTRGRVLPDWLGSSVGSLAGFLALWIFLYLGAMLLLRIPPEFHQGSVWQKVIKGPHLP
jgi:hypothetical protein